MSDPQLLKGVLPMLVLAVLTEHESYGYELVTRLQDAGLDEMSAGTVYPVLNRLERDGLVASRLVASSAGPARKYYVPTADGRTELARAAAAWERLGRTASALLARALARPPVPGSAPAEEAS
ncbi:PadR family transcriptional regulator [Cellulomonas sp.]|uniref:PadR family transcriptional regulator n=1 Tax=Cellulomonas sp. TaxID=40001 RepID=UPI001B1E6061|nr:PadR family transcriptional regulator [Cellulomonas sp.]MBO9554212.1 PadR family transcriptional regulator [Cellulomonas sp.]